MSVENEFVKETPMMRQFNEIKRQHPDKILFFRMGDFYEMFGEDAIKASSILQVQLTTRNKKDANALPMCGVPYHSYSQYLDRLTKAGLKVAICEQTEDASQANGLVKREVIRIVTPGTTLSSNLVETSENSYIAMLYHHSKSKKVALAFCDLSTGEFEVTQFSRKLETHQILETLYLYHPKELLLSSPNNDEEKEWQQEICTQLKHLFHIPDHQDFGETFETSYFEVKRSKRVLQSHFSVHSLASFGIEEMEAVICVAGALIHYLKELQQDSLKHICHIKQIGQKDVMQLDEATICNLELFQNAGDNQKHTLLFLLNQTQTPMGARLLKKWLGSPLIKQAEIEQRLDHVEIFLKNPNLLVKLQKVLRQIGDLERIISRIALPIVHISDFVKLRNGLSPLIQIHNILQDFNSSIIQEQITRFDPLSDLLNKLNTYFLEEPANKIKEGDYIAKGFNERLDTLRNLKQNGKQLIANLEAKEKKETKIQSLKVKFNKVFGYYFEVSNASKHLVPEHYIRKQTLVNAERYVTEELKELEENLLTAEDEANALEMELFHTICLEFKEEIPRIRKTAQIIAIFDVFSSLACVAQNYNYTRPLFDSNHEHLHIQEGRHPVIESINFEEPFVPNDTLLKTTNQRMILITGPNMGGKSTYMRQTALIALMAQIGAFVPAKYACLPIFDRIFTRVGASDNLTRGQSTFMVEMNEAASILNHATEKSLVILDEIGRGTSTFDGISIAWSIAEELHHRKSMTLFATHYHELTLLENQLEGVANFYLSVAEEDGKIVFLRKILPGKTNKSYGIQVAKLAGLSNHVIEQAKTILHRLENTESNFGNLAQNNLSETDPFKYDDEVYNVNSVREDTPIYKTKKQEKEKLQKQQQQKEQLSFFPHENTILKEINSFNVNQKTPLEAMQFLSEIQQKISSDKKLDMSF